MRQRCVPRFLPPLQGGFVRNYKPRLKPGLCFHGLSGRPLRGAGKATRLNHLEMSKPPRRGMKAPGFTLGGCFKTARPEGAPDRMSNNAWSSALAGFSAAIDKHEKLPSCNRSLGWRSGRAHRNTARLRAPISAAPSAPPTRRTGCFSNKALLGNAL
jgi:hypothetical protein